MDKFFKIVGRTTRRFFTDGVGRASAQLAYYLFFSLFPIIILVNAVISRFGVDIKYVVQRFDYLFPRQMTEIVTDYLDYLTGIESTTFAIGAIFTALYALTRAFNSLLNSVRAAYRIKRAGAVNYMTAFILSAFIMIAFFLLTILILGGEVVVTELEKYIYIPDSIISLLQLIKFVLLPAVIFLTLCGFYYIVPSRRFRFRRAVPGSVFSLLGLTVVTMAFSYYISHFSNYSLLYGSLAAVMILMVWLKLVATILIMGGELNYVIIEMTEDRLGYTRDKKSESK